MQDISGWRRQRGVPRKDAVRVHVDVKILNRHDPKLKMSAYVGYKVEGENVHGVARTEAVESDDGEIQAILFAIRELKGRYGRLTILCDHQSVVSEAKRKDVKHPSPLLAELRELLRRDDQIQLKGFESNLAHQVVTEYVNTHVKNREEE